MDARGLVAFVVTLHEVAAVLALLVGALMTALGLLVLRNVPAGRRALMIAAFAVGASLATLAVSSRLFHVSALEVEVVRVSP